MYTITFLEAPNNIAACVRNLTMPQARGERFLSLKSTRGCAGAGPIICPVLV